MAEATFVHDGNAVDYTPGSAVAAGDVVVQETLIGVAKTSIAASALGALAVSGVFDFAKATGVGEGIAAGKKVYWDNTNNVATETVDTNPYLGKVVAAAGDDDATERVRLEQ